MSYSKRVTSKTGVWLLTGLLVLVLLFEGHHLSGLLPRAEDWIQSLGPWAPLAFIAVVVALEPLLVPNTLLGMTAGAVFGLWKGYLLYFGGVYLASVVVYLMGRWLFRGPVLRMLDAREEIGKAVAAAKRQGVRLVFWIRLLPLNPAIFSYAFGALQVPFRAFAVGTLAMFLPLFVDVYLGAMAAHVTKMSGTGHADWAIRDLGLLLGLVAAGVVSWRVGRIASAEIQAGAAS